MTGKSTKPLEILAREAGLEPTTHGLEGRCSIQSELLALGLLVQNHKSRGERI
jgi:hypothetical protein